MSILADARVLYHLTFAPVRGETHAERLESFYRGQSQEYDTFRRKLLKGREELVRQLPLEPGGVWVDLGGGTATNQLVAGERLAGLSQVYLVDLAPSLLQVAEQRIAEQRWTNVKTCHADATTFMPPQSADVVTFSYALTMIPDWFAAVEQAWRMLRPGGTIGVVDFYISRKHPPQPRVRHSWLARTVMPTWFAADNVFLSGDHLPFLEQRFETVHLFEHTSRLPYVPFLKAPYYIFVGRKRNADA